MAKFEMRFKGKDNAGLRAKIRAQVKAFDDGHSIHETRYDAIMGLKRTVGLTALGLATLEQVAQDYEERWR